MMPTDRACANNAYHSVEARGLTTDKIKEFGELISLMDRAEKGMLLSALDAVAAAKSKGWRTRRINNFRRWLENRRTSNATTKAA